ncbi:MAG: hypothetical protein GY757_22740 [bacterium]|nr:hypothetical protein [bacterium]
MIVLKTIKESMAKWKSKEKEILQKFGDTFPLALNELPTEIKIQLFIEFCIGYYYLFHSYDDGEEKNLGRFLVELPNALLKVAYRKGNKELISLILETNNPDYKTTFSELNSLAKQDRELIFKDPFSNLRKTYISNDCFENNWRILRRLCLRDDIFPPYFIEYFNILNSEFYDEVSDTYLDSIFKSHYYPLTTIIDTIIFMTIGIIGVLYIIYLFVTEFIKSLDMW